MAAQPTPVNPAETGPEHISGEPETRHLSLVPPAHHSETMTPEQQVAYALDLAGLVPWIRSELERLPRERLIEAGVQATKESEGPPSSDSRLMRDTLRDLPRIADEERRRMVREGNSLPYEPLDKH